MAWWFKKNKSNENTQSEVVASSMKSASSPTKVTAPKKVMHTYRVELFHKGSYGMEVLKVDDTDLFNWKSLPFDERYVYLFENGSEYINFGGLPEKFKRHFELDVFDEHGKRVFSTTIFKNIKFISSESTFDSAVRKPNGNCMSAKKVCKKIWEKEQNEIDAGRYVAAVHELKWVNYSFTVRDESFDHKKLFFIKNNRMNGFLCKYMTDATHIMYDDQLVEAVDEGDSIDEYGYNYYIVEKERGGKWKLLEFVED
jgi:hypothetical protein